MANSGDIPNNITMGAGTMVRRNLADNGFEAVAPSGSGTVTNVSVTTANGVSGTVATSTTTPAITLSLGAITPSSVNSVVVSGTSTPTLSVTGTSSISGANTGDQTITLSGDVSGTGTGAITTTIGAGKVTEAMQVLADNTTNDVSSSAHGYVPKALNNPLKFLDSYGTWKSPYVHVSKSSGATTTGANTTPVSVSGAVFSYEASSTYWIRVMGRINSTAATTGGAIQFDLSSAVTAIDVIGGNLLASSGTASFFASVADDTTLGTGTSGVPSGPVDVPIFAQALLVTAGNTGTCQLRFRSETTAVTELMAGTVMVVERLI